MANKGKKRLRVERRCGNDRRSVYDAAYFSEGGLERRNVSERRCNDQWREALINLLERKGIVSHQELFEEIDRLAGKAPE